MNKREKAHNEFIELVTEAMETTKPAGDSAAFLAGLVVAATSIHLRLSEILEKMDKEKEEG